MRKSWTVALAAAMVITAFPGVAHAGPTTDDDPRFIKVPKVKIDPKLLPSPTNPTASIKVIVELKDDPVAVVQAKQGGKISAAQKKQVTDKLRSKQSGVASKVKSKGGKVQSQMQSAYNGMQVQLKAGDVAALAADPNVKAIHAVPTYQRTNAASVPSTGAPQVWQDTGYSGKGVKIAIIDTGIDYTHADFGGPGTKAAYRQAASSNTPNPAWFGPKAPRVKGGIDMVGDAYYGGNEPVPDANPVDCEGHGTHVAGTAAGGGVKADGSAFTGPYNAKTPSLKFKVGPGMAPEADLYAVKIFGCEGGTNMTTEAIDWAVANGMDVMNLSLGSDYGRVDAPDAVAASNAVAAGVVVVAAAGNAGPAPYLVGSPASGPGVIAVAAQDSVKAFPGARLIWGKSRIPAINSNGVALASTPYTVVVLTDDPATAENEALGCSKRAFTRAGITTDPKAAPVLAVTVRGVCARTSRAIYGQQAGADAVAMINTDPSYPPYEAEITQNLDNGRPYQVTIPFLGVRGVLGAGATNDGDALVKAAGQKLTTGAITITNPDFGALASTSSGGPASGNSELRPSIAAPGVSIASAGVGTGTGAATESGTSMASPHVAGAAALVRQAHPTWAAWQISDAIVTTADPTKVKNYSVVTSGAGALDVRRAVKTQTTISGERVVTDKGTYREPTLSFGLQEFPVSFNSWRGVSVTNHSKTTQTYRFKVQAASGSKPASVKVFPSEVQLPPGGSTIVRVSMWADANKMGSSLQNDGTQARFNHVSGAVVATSGGGEQVRIPYLMVPRATSQARRSGPNINHNQAGTSSVTVTNYGTKVTSTGDVFTWVLSDPRGDAGEKPTSTGYDIRAVGVQTIPKGKDSTIVFAVNNWTPFAAGALTSYLVFIDTNRDGDADRLLQVADTGEVEGAGPTGILGVFVGNLKNGATVPGTFRSAGYLAVAPTNSSTVLIAVDASDLGVSPTTGAFDFTMLSLAIDNFPLGDVTETASYDPFHKPFSDGQQVRLGADRATQIKVNVDPKQWGPTKPLGQMVVVFDNPAGQQEAVLFGVR